MSGQRFGSVWDAIEDTPEEAENMKLRSVLIMALKKYIEQSGMGQGQAAKLFGVTQPRISDLVRGKIGLFALDALVNMVSAADMHVEMRIVGQPVKKPAAKKIAHTGLNPAAKRAKVATNRSGSARAGGATVRARSA
jgi:predicted XRE-type DNA-binding protein